MSTILLALAWTLAALAAALLLVPFHLRAYGEIEESEGGGVFTGTWAWGLLEVRVAPDGEVEILVLRRTLRRMTLDELRREKSPAAKKPGPKPKVFFEHRATLMEILKRLVVALRVRARVSGSVGLDRPDHTAYLGLALDELNAASSRVEIDVAPNYLEPSILLRGTVSALVWPARLLALAAALITQRDTRQLLQALR